MSEEKNKFQENAKIIKIRDYLLETYDFRHNTVTQRLEFRQRGEADYVDFDNRFKSDLIIELKTLKFNKPKEDLDDILNSSIIPIYSPISEYFENIEYKGTGFIKQLTDLIVLEDLKLRLNKPYHDMFEEYFKKWLTACYLCATNKSINDVMLILIGGQGLYKTTFLNYLIPEELKEYRVCSHINPSLSDYNTASYLAEKFMINIDDQMENIFGKDYNSMKAIISAPDVSMRKLYKSDHKRRLRIANFCGSVNEPKFLRDSTNRRYLCFQIKSIDKTYIDIDINALWAEIKHEADKLKSYYIWGRNEFEEIEILNEHFSSPTIGEENLKSLFVPADEDDNDDVIFLTYAEIIKLLRIYSGDNNIKEYEVKTAMRKFKYKSFNKRLRRFKDPRSVYAVKLANYEQIAYTLISPYRENETEF